MVQEHIYGRKCNYLSCLWDSVSLKKNLHVELKIERMPPLFILRLYGKVSLCDVSGKTPRSSSSTGTSWRSPGLGMGDWHSSPWLAITLRFAFGPVTHLLWASVLCGCREGMRVDQRSSGGLFSANLQGWTGFLSASVILRIVLGHGQT